MKIKTSVFLSLWVAFLILILAIYSRSWIVTIIVILLALFMVAITRGEDE
jgi:hypothetical protein